jgi:lipopolysaccharide biosynthesis protein
MKTLVLYVFHIFNGRVQNFIDKAIFQDEDTDFIVICNDKTIDFKVPAYVKILKRDNIGFDFGGWTDALLTDDLYKSYDRFIFVNSSVLGPFLPDRCSGKWTDIYFAGLKDNIKLFGSTINTCAHYRDPRTYSHVQSYIFAMNRETLDLLISGNIFSKDHYARTFNEAIKLKEIRMSQIVLANGGNIGCLMKHYRGVDFTFKVQPKVPLLGDIMINVYRNVVWNEYDLVFIKGNRGIIL